jgi:hypothetical protein
VAEMAGYGAEEMEMETAAPATEPARGGRIKPKEHKLLRERFKCGTKYYETAFKPHFDRCLELYQGNHHLTSSVQAKADKAHCLVVNYIKYSVRTAFNSVSFNLPDIITKPQTEASEQNEDTTRRAVNYEYRVSKAHREMQRAEFDYFLCDLGVVYTYWDFQTSAGQWAENERQPVEGEEPEPEDILRAVETGEPLAPPIPKEKVRKDNFGVRRIDPRCFRIDPECDSVLDNAIWCGYVEYVPLERVKRNPLFKNTKNLKGSTKNLAGYFSDEMNKEKDLPSDVKRVELWHYWEKERRIHCVYTTEHDQPLLEEDWHWEADRYPFRVNCLPGSESEFYPNPPRLVDLEHMQQEINQGRSQLATIRERCNPFFISIKGTLDQQGKKQLENGTVNRVVEVNASSADQALSAARHSTLPVDFWNALEKAESDFQKLSGLTQYEAGAAPSKRMTSAEVQAVSGSSAALRRADVQKFEEFCAGVAEDCHAWLQQFAIRTRSLPIYDNNEIVEWRDYTKEDIRGEYEFQVFVGSTEIKDQKGQVEEIGYALQTLTPFAQMMNPQTGQPVIDVTELLRQFLKALPEIRNVDAIVGPSSPQPGMPPQMLPPGMEGMDPMGGALGGPVAGEAPSPEMALPPALLAQLGTG